MKQPIKIVYNWIGPRGPIWNTEVPNVLGFAAAQEGANSNSSFWWADDIWHKLFNSKRPAYELHPTCLIEDQDVFVFPFSLAWRVNMRNYFLADNGILEFSHTPNHIIHQVRCGKGFFLIDLSAEAFVQDGQLKAMHSYFNHLKIPLGKVIYLTGCMNADTLYDRFCQRHNIPKDILQRMTIISYPVSQQGFAQSLSCLPENHFAIYDTETVPEKTFLSWNRRFRRHRTTLALAMEKHGLIDKSYVSMGLTDPESSMERFENTIDLFRDPALEISAEDVARFINKLPLVLDGETNIAQMCGDFNNATRQWYKNSLVSIVTETNYDLQELTLTEKSFKPLKEKHPFIIVGVPGALRAFKNLGFKTFSEFWNEEYDEIEDPRIRMKEIVNTMCDIASWDANKILEFKRKVKPIVDHNFELLKKDLSEVVADKITMLLKLRYNL